MGKTLISLFDKVDHFHFVEVGETAQETVRSVVEANAETLFGSGSDTNSVYKALLKTLSNPVEDADLISCMNDLDFSLVIKKL